MGVTEQGVCDGMEWKGKCPLHLVTEVSGDQWHGEDGN